ncbi:MAG TPA: magnesium transporter CorA family protein [Armatimonadota bacterium]|jgi:magnesium transporter
MIRLRIYNPTDGFREEDGIARLADLVGKGKDVVWAMAESPTDAELDELGSALGIHRITMEDARQEEDRPRLRHYNDVMSIVFFAVECPNMVPEEMTFQPLRLFLSPRYLVTVTDAALPQLDEAYARWRDNTDVLESNTEAPMYTILDSVVDGFFPVVDIIADRVDDIEDLVIDGAAGETRQAVFTMKRSLVRLRRVAAAGRDVVNAIVRHDETTPDPDSIYLRDVYDHLNRITDAVDTYRDLLSNVMDAYLSVTSNRLAESANRLNVIMQTLTSWSIILGSGTLITGFYGMNTSRLPFAQHPFSYEIVLGLCLIVGGLLYGMFRRKRWL